MSQQKVEPGQPPSARFISVFALGCGAGMRFRGPLARQVTDEIAAGLSRFSTLVARPHHLVAAEQVDPTLDEGLELTQLAPGRATPALEFILFSTLPADSMVRELTLGQGNTMALSGRMVLDGEDLDLALNLWDVGPPNLLWCRLLYGQLDDLPAMIADVVGHLAHRLEAPEAEDLGAAIEVGRQSVGTDSQRALFAYASVTDKLRRARLDARASLRHPSVAAGLISALEIDPRYEAPRLLLLEHALDRFEAGDEAYASALLTQLDRLQEQRLLFALLRLEAQLTLGEREAARVTLDEARSRWPDDERVDLAATRFGA